MELKKLYTEERAVSPVIAVVLMIAVTVILAAIVAAFALGLGGGADQTPQASFDFDHGGAGTVHITHEGGDSLVQDRVTVRVNGVDDTPTTDWVDDPIKTGSKYETAVVAAGDEVRIAWEGDNGETATLATYQVPT